MVSESPQWRQLSWGYPSAMEWVLQSWATAWVCANLSGHGNKGLEMESIRLVAEVLGTGWPQEARQDAQGRKSELSLT